MLLISRRKRSGGVPFGGNISRERVENKVMIFSPGTTRERAGQGTASERGESVIKDGPL